MGEIQSTSYLGQPLRARIPLHQIGDFSVEQLKIALASPQEHERFGVEPAYQLRNIRMNVVVQDDQSYVELTSREPIVEPYLDFVLTLRWSDGALVKNFTVLLDPINVAEKSFAEKPAASRVVSSGKGQSKAVSSHRVEQPRFSQKNYSKKIYDVESNYIIQPGDSLWIIAGRFKPDGVSREAMMSVIHRSNLHAFINGNAEKLKAIETIKIPAGKELAALLQNQKLQQPEPKLAEKNAQPEEKSSDTKTVKKQDIVTAAETTDLQVAERAQYQREITELTTRVETLTTELTQTHEKMTVLQTQMQGLIDQYQQLSAKEQASRREIAQQVSTDSAINTLEASGVHTAVVNETPLWIHASYLLAIFVLACWVLWDHRQFVERRLLARLTSHQALPQVRARSRAGFSSQHDGSVTRASTADKNHITDQDSSIISKNNVGNDWSHIHRSDVLPSVGEEHRDPLLTASAYAAFGRYSEAEDILSQAIIEMPERSDFYLELLQVYIRSGNIDKMIEMQESIAEKFSNDEGVQKELRRLS